MNRFNLTFRGEIIEGHDPERVKTRLARMLSIDDPARLQRLFSGDPVVLRRNMERKEAAELYARLRRQGIQAELVKIGERGDLHSGEAAKTPTSAAAIAAAARTAETGGKPTQVPAPEATGNPSKVIRTVYLGAGKALEAKDRSQLEARDKAPKKALKVKEREAAKRSRASARTREKALAREASDRARREAAQRREQQQRQQQEEVEARRRAELARAQAQEAARQAERERVETERLERLAAERAEREQREAEERERLAAERERQEQARLAEQQRLAAEKAARRAQEKQKAEQLAARLQVEQARRKREQAAESARRKAEEVRKRAQDQARQQAEAEQQLAQRRAMEEQAIQRAATALAHKPALKPAGARVRTRLETPSRLRRPQAAPGEGRRKRQPGAPNLYSLRPFRNTPEVRARADQSQRIMRLAFTCAAIAVAISLALALRLLSLAPPMPFGGAGAGAIGPQGRLLLLAADHLLLHDRAGVGVADLPADRLGLASLGAPLAFDAAGELLITGQLANEPAGGQPRLLRCVLAEPHCEPFPADLAGAQVSALAVNPLDGSLLIADGHGGQLLKLGPDGAVLARADAAIPPAPVLRLDSGLLLVNSAQGAAISIFRYEDQAFGKQLDELLLLPPADGAGEFTAVRDFVRSGDYWWVLLDRTGSDSAGLYRFDSHWKFVDQPPLAAGSRPVHLLNWGGRVLILDPSRMPVQRFSSSGLAEAPLVSKVLTELAATQEHRANLTLLGWRLGLALGVLGAVAGLVTGSLHRVRRLVYKSCRERGAEPIDELADAIDWLELAPDRSASLRRTGITYALLVTGLVLGAIGLGVSSLQLSALLLSLAGPATALILLQRSDPGHIGIHDNTLLLVDHDGMYHLGSGSRIHCHGPFLMIDDVTVFSGTGLLPAFDPTEVARRVAPLAAQGVQVDRKIVTVKLLQGRHPLALGVVAIVATFAAAAALLSLQGIF